MPWLSRLPAWYNERTGQETSIFLLAGQQASLAAEQLRSALWRSPSRMASIILVLAEYVRRGDAGTTVTDDLAARLSNCLVRFSATTPWLVISLTLLSTCRL